MRIHLKLTASNTIVPFSYQPNLVGAFHKWLGPNAEHDQLSLYSLSWLSDAKVLAKGLRFRNGTTWFISSPDINLIKRVLSGIQQDPAVAFGMQVAEVWLQEPPRFPETAAFKVVTPVLVKRRGEEGVKHYSYSDDGVDDLLTETMRNKLKRMGMEDKEVSVRFDRTYATPKQKVVEYKGVRNKANVCPVIISGDREAVAFAWEVGVGNCTGIGFGALQ